MIPFCAALEATSLSIWLRESESLLAFPFVLILHTVGLAFLAGANIALDIRVLGFARQIPLPAMTRYVRVAWLAFVVNALSGILLLIAYPTKSLTNPLFYVKLVLIAWGMIAMCLIAKRASHASVTPPSHSVLAFTSLACWLLAIAAGRLLAYTYHHLLA